METVTHPFKHGPRKQLTCIKGDPWTGRSVELYGEYSESEVDVFREFIRPDDVCVDAGALFGAHTLAMADLGRLVMAFEPQEIPRTILLANTMNRPVLVWSDALGCSFRLNHMTALPHFGTNRIDESGSVAVSMSPLDSYADVFKSVGFIKIDVEGYEPNVLTGAEQTILSDSPKPVIYVEFQENKHSIAAILKEYGYQELWTHHAPQDRFPNCNMRPLEEDPGPGPVMLLAIPQHRFKEHESFVKERFTRI